MNNYQYNNGNQYPPPLPKKSPLDKVNPLKIILIVIVGCFVLLIFIIFFGAITGAGGDVASADSTKVEKKKKKASEWCNWKYTTETDFMEDKEMQFAILRSLPKELTNGDKEILRVGVRKKDGRDDVYLTLEHLTFYGTELKNTKYIKFRDAMGDKAITFTFSYPQDMDVKTVFLDNPKKFIKEVKKSEIFFIEVPTFTSGRGIFEFVTDSTLVWK